MIDKTDLIRKKLVDMAKKKVKSVYKGMYDKVLIIYFLVKGVRAERIEKAEEKELK